MGENPTAKHDVNVRDLWRIIRKRRAVVILATLLFAGASFFFSSFFNTQARYEATSAVKVERVTDLTSLLLGTVYWSIRDNVATQAVIITSFPTMERTAKEMGLISEDIPAADVRKSAKYLQIINSLKSRVTTQLEENTNIINIHATGETPSDAVLLANTVAEAFRQANLEERNKKIRETREFIEKQLEVVQARLQEAEDNLRSFEENTKLVAIDTQTNAAVNRLTSLESEAARLQQQRLEVQKQLDFLRQRTQGTGGGQEGFYMENPPPQFARLSGKLADLNLRRSVLLNEFKEDHPEVKDVVVEIKNVLSEMDKELRSMLTSMDRRLQDLEERLRASRAQTKTIPESALTLARLRREVDVNAQLYSQLKSKYQEALIQESGLIEEVKVVKPAIEASSSKNSHSLPANTFMGGVIGLVVGLVLSLVLETMDTSLATIEEVEHILQVPVLGVIPSADRFIPRERDKREESQLLKDCLVTHFAPRSPVSESYRSLRTNFQLIRKDKKAKVFLVTSSTVQEGKTYNVVNLSLSLAQAGEKVLLVDADLHRPVIHRIFGVPRQPGLADYILGDFDRSFLAGAESLPPTPDLIDPNEGTNNWHKVVNDITSVMLGAFDIDELLRTPGIDNLHFITAGAMTVNSAELLRSPRFKQFLGQARDRYDIIIIDTPPVLPVADAYEVAPAVDGVVLVYEAGRIGRGLLRRAKDQLENVNGNVRGVILNNVKPEVAPDLYHYGTDYYYSKQSGEEERVNSSGWGHSLARMMGGISKRARLDSAAAEGGGNKRTAQLSLGLLLIATVAWQSFPALRSLYLQTAGSTTNPAVTSSRVQRNTIPKDISSKPEEVVTVPMARRGPSVKSVNAVTMLGRGSEKALSHTMSPREPGQESSTKSFMPDRLVALGLSASAPEVEERSVRRTRPAKGKLESKVDLAPRAPQTVAPLHTSPSMPPDRLLDTLPGGGEGGT